MRTTGELHHSTCCQPQTTNHIGESCPVIRLADDLRPTTTVCWW